MNNNVVVERRQRDISGVIHTSLKSRDAIDSDMDILDLDEELDAILDKEKDLVVAHRKQVEDTLYGHQSEILVVDYLRVERALCVGQRRLSSRRIDPWIAAIEFGIWIYPTCIGVKYCLVFIMMPLPNTTQHVVQG